MRRLLVAALFLVAGCEPYANDPMRRAWFQECDYESQRAVAGQLSMASRVADRIELNRQCMALKERQAGLR